VKRHFELLGRLAYAVLPVEGAAAYVLATALARLAADLPGDFELARHEVHDLLARQAETLEPHAPGGAGGGVQVLSATAARGRTFARLYLLGLNRGAFPRGETEDPLLPDASRRALRALLPDLPVKAEGRFEERWLFDHLLAAAPTVTLSFCRRSDDGAEQQVSPLLDRFSWRDAATRRLRERWQTPLAPGVPAPGDLPTPPLDAARAAALAGDRARYEALLPAALAEARGGSAPTAEDRNRSRARLETLRELDPDPQTPEGGRIWRRLGPFFGRVGPGALGRDPLWVTQVEGLVACGWQLLLVRGLGLEPVADPVGELPQPLEQRLVGVAGHRVLERLLGGALGAERPTTLASALASAGRALAFPTPARLAAEADAAARELLAEEGLTAWGFERLLAAAVTRRVERARVDWAAGERTVLGVEIEGRAELAPWGGARSLRFRADRVDREGGKPVLTDYKPWDVARLRDRAGGERLLRHQRAGELLQVAAYVAALGGQPATGRFLALGEADEERPDADPVAAREAALDEAARESLAALARVTDVAERARLEGRFLPRLVDPSGRQSGPACEWCLVKEACLQGDSGARHRLRRWAEDRRARGPESDAAGDRVEAELFLLVEAARAEPAP
jgi:hypothetical protein